MSFHPALAIITAALNEDLAQGDMTVDHLPQLHSKTVKALIRNRSRCVVSGVDVAQLVFTQLANGTGNQSLLQVECLAQAGQQLEPNSTIMSVEGSAALILKAERTALNFLQHCSGIATETRKYVDAIAGANPKTQAKIAHTRKTTPGLRYLERQAVIDGGGSPHRYNLGAAVMLKDNHLSMTDLKTGVAELRSKISHTATITVEADNLSQVNLALEAGADIILLDNMSPAIISEALVLIGDKAISEASGNISLDTVYEYAKTGVNIISTSKITLGAPAIDIGLDFI